MMADHSIDNVVQLAKYSSSLLYAILHVASLIFGPAHGKRLVSIEFKQIRETKTFDDQNKRSRI